MGTRPKKTDKSYRWLAAAAVSLALLLAAAKPCAAEDELAARRAVHFLEYVAADYPAAVAHGTVISRLEYAEQIEFVGQVADTLQELGIGREDALSADVAKLLGLVENRGPSQEVQSQSRRLASEVRKRFSVVALPPRPPSLEHGRELYAQACVSCHGIEGRGDGEQAAKLDPAPSDFTSPKRAHSLSPLASYNTITLGIEGTAMASFAEAFDEASRYDLAFFIGSLAFTPEQLATGMALSRDHQANLPSLIEITTQPASTLGLNPQEMAVVAFLRTHPEELYRSDSAVEFSRQRIVASWAAFANGNKQAAKNLAVSAYLDGFEQIEPLLDTVDRDLRLSVEASFINYRGALAAGGRSQDAENAYTALLGALASTEETLEVGTLGVAALFTAAMTIIAREGAEAVLIIAALCAILIRSSRRDALRYIHVGWIAALAAGAATWLLTRELIELSGAQREVIEGLASLLAAAILFYVSYWLIAQVRAERWQNLLSSKLDSALSQGSLWILAGVSFVAVYRELLETILFFTALSTQAGNTGARPILLGIACGLGLVVLIAVALLRLGLRVPLRGFFTGSSALLYALAIVMSGQGVAALQEAQWLPATPIPTIRIDWLGVYPTLEGMALQSLIVVACLIAAVSIMADRQRAAAAQSSSPSSTH